MRKYWLLTTLLAFQFSAYADFSFNNNCQDAYEAAVGLRLNEAKALISKEKQLNPNNGIGIWLDNYITFFGLMASENKTEYEQQKSLRVQRLTELEKQANNSPYYLYTQAEIYMQWGLLKGRFGDYFSSAMDLNKAQSLFKENAKKYPDFLPNQKGLALINVVFGSIPSSLQKTLRLVGIKGDADAGVKQLTQLLKEISKSKYSFVKDELVFYRCYIDIDVLHQKDNYKELIGYINQMDSNSLLKVYLQGHVASKTGHNEDAINYLEANTVKNAFQNFPMLSYILGNAKLNRMDKDAPIYLTRYIADYKGLNYIKDSYLKLAYFYLLNNDRDKYHAYLKLVKTKGYTVDEKDKQALKEANDDEPDIDLLKARLYFDGAAYAKALALLKNKDASDFKLLRDKIELNYRLGRIYEETNQFNEALANYQKAINAGKTSSYYFAANAALRIGNIFEQQKDFTRAAAFYKQAIDMKDHEYETSIENQAKEGLKRINKL